MDQTTTPQLTMRYGATAWGLEVTDKGNDTSFDFSKMERGDRSKVRRMTVDALKQMGYFNRTKVAA